MSEEKEINYSTKVIVDGKEYFQSLAHQLAKHICSKVYDEFRLTAEFGFTSATLYIERVLMRDGCFVNTKYSDKKCLGMLLYDIEKNRMILRKTNVKTEVHEFHADEKRQMNDCFGVQYEIFKYLRDSDLIHIHTIEKKVRHKEKFVYMISKLKAVRNGRFLHFGGYGTQFFIPKEDFKCVAKGIYKEPKKKKGVK